MNFMRLFRFLFGFYFLHAVEGDGGGDGDLGAAQEVAGDSGEMVAVEAPAGDKPATMLDAISQALDAPEGGQPRDEKGRFAQKAAEEAAAAAAVAAQAKPGDPTKPAVAKPAETTEDILQMPEGLKPESQQRFQKLVNVNKELTQKFEQAEQQTSYIRETFQQHGVRREQFEQAVQFIGAINSGNLEDALKVLDQQRAEIALALGRPLPGVNVIDDHQDLRAAVDAMQITEAHAMEIARARRADQMAQQHHQNQQQTQQRQQQEQQAINTGLTEIDQFCKQMAGSDMDYPAIEAQLLPEIQNLIRGVAPSMWKHTIETQYRLLKKVAGGARNASTGPSGTVLRPTGAASPAARPRSAFEAMWGQPAPSV
jgi:hypothetical protein